MWRLLLVLTLVGCLDDPGDTRPGPGPEDPDGGRFNPDLIKPGSGGGYGSGAGYGSGSGGPPRPDAGADAGVDAQTDAQGSDAAVDGGVAGDAG